MNRRGGCGCSPISHRLQLHHQGDHRLIVAVAPRSPHRLQCPAGNRLGVSESCGCLPRSPIGYNTAGRVVPLASSLRLLPDLPSATMQAGSEATRAVLRLLPDLPSATIPAGIGTGELYVAVAPRSPIGYNTPPRDHHVEGVVAVAPPISHRLQYCKRTDADFHSCGCSPISHRLQSMYVALPWSTSCGCSPISHRLQSDRLSEFVRRSCGCSPISHRLQ